MRTLRHYHQVGVLEEPNRSSNGYRDYDTRALVTVLRIRRLADLGFSLAQVSAMLHGGDPVPDDGFESLDAELAQQIERLNRQRETLAHLRRHGVPADLPPQIAAAHEVLRRSGLSREAAELDRDHTLLLAQLVGDHGQGYVTAVYDLLSRPERARAAAAAMTAWATLDEESTDRSIAELAEQLSALFLPVLAELGAVGGAGLPSISEARLREHTADYLTAAQERLLRVVRGEMDKALPTET